MTNITNYKPIIDEVKKIINDGRNAAYQYANKAMIETYWNVGRRIVEEEQKGKERAGYGDALIKTLSDELTKEFGKGYNKRNLANMRKFYLYFPRKSILHARVQNLTWTHYRCLLRVDDDKAREWYLKEASSQNWSTRQLDRNIATQYYYRLLKTPYKFSCEDKPGSIEDIIKSPIMAEFLGFRNEDSFSESDLENAIITHLREFIMELGSGFAYVGRQQHITTESKDYYIDLVFYNIFLKCYVLFDLKIGEITHQDIGQMDMYIRMYDDLVCKEDDNPTIGIVLCSETNKDIAKYSIVNDHNNLYMAKYLTCLPSKEDLENEVRKQKELFYINNKEDNVS